MEENNNIILFSALDWGLGHTTRSIPILTYYKEQGFNLLIACAPGSATETILGSHFPEANFLPLKGYNISYAKNRKGFVFKLILQIPKILRAIRREHAFVGRIVKKYPIRLIISDNRYGFYHPAVKSVFITHQLTIAAPAAWLEHLIQRINYRYIDRFSTCWVPDLAGQLNMAGKLSHPKKLPAIPVQYIGPLSRLQSVSLSKSSPQPGICKYTYLFLLSGPEPGRSLLEQQILAIAFHLPGHLALVRGLPGENTSRKGKTYFGRATDHPGYSWENNFQSGAPASDSLHPPLEVYDYADPDLLHALVSDACFVVCRSGYSTVMELLLLGKKAIYIPTPGQTEQEYLALQLKAQHWAFSFAQESKDYLAMLNAAHSFDYTLPVFQLGDINRFLDQHGQPANDSAIS